MSASRFEPHPKLDLVLERTVDVPRELLWKGWTQPEHMYKWFVPKPWSLAHAEVDLRPGGSFKTIMRSPEGQEFPGEGCYLEIKENERLIWTSALLPGYRPVAKLGSHDLPFTAVILLEHNGKGTKYTAIAIHGNEESREAHAKMGFVEGWGICLDQLVAEIKAGRIQ